MLICTIEVYGGKGMGSIYDGAGERIYQLRTQRGLTREELCELSGVSAKFLYEIEIRKKGFSAETLYKISNALSVRSDYILSGNDYKKQDKKLTDTLQKFNQSDVEELNELLSLVHVMMNKSPN